jgi:hypothetical protein
MRKITPFIVSAFEFSYCVAIASALVFACVASYGV